MKQHHYNTTIEWTGNRGSGTDHYKNYERSHRIIIGHKADIEGSSDPAFRGDASKHNPEDLLLASLSSCHMLWYLHFCAVDNIVVEEYIDHATAVMVEEENGKGSFKEAILHPIVRVKTAEMIAPALALHRKASEYCFIANSVNFQVSHRPTVQTEAVNRAT
ncbi:OsmC family protein [Sphingobacterium sp. N143]|uniref:OsmC family protein n=1 Tax=Sphingobacterium sp. N143 TaxID=2746727 RepID=UPI002577583A|nr:OsmC family protein [Sphingobacterium sp. N143]MDM1296234.1 OsmC family protein [Sphingobacterium sp. N143]